MRDELLSAGSRPGTLDRIIALLDPLAPGIILSDSERTWLNTAWQTSGVVADQDRTATLADLGRRLAQEHSTPAMFKHANSSEYRGAMQAFCLIVGREGGRRGLGDSEIAAVLDAALEALPQPA